MSRLRVGVIGVGHLGQHHARIISKLEGACLVAVADSRIDQARRVAEPLGAPAFEHHEALFELVDAVSIAAPTRFHRDIAAAFLMRGIPVMVEKPIAMSLAEAEELVNLASRHQALLQVGHIERFNPTLRALERLPMRPRYLSAERLSTFTLRSVDIGAVLDLMIHDIDLVLSLVQSPVVAVSAIGTSVFHGHEDIANARIWFEDGSVADLSASRASMHTARKLRMYGAEGYVGLDFKTKQALLVRPSPALRDGSLQLEGVDTSRPDDVKAHLFGKVLEIEHFDASGDSREPLALELADFVASVRERRVPRVSGEAALKAMSVADLVLQGIASHPWDGLGTTQAEFEPGARGIPAPHLMRMRAPKVEGSVAK